MIRRLNDAPGQLRLIADAEIRCRRCGRRLRSNRAVVAGIGRGCARAEAGLRSLDLGLGIGAETQLPSPKT